MKCKYCKKDIFFAYWHGGMEARELTDDGGSKSHTCWDTLEEKRLRKEEKKC